MISEPYTEATLRAAATEELPVPMASSSLAQSAGVDFCLSYLRIQCHQVAFGLKLVEAGHSEHLRGGVPRSQSDSSNWG